MAATTQLTAKLGEFIAEFNSNDAPRAARELAVMGASDSIGVMIAGRREEAPAILERVLMPAGTQATLHFSGRKASAAEAAWINATAGHVLDYDDIAIQGHPSAVMVPAIFAQAQARGATGAQIIDAYIVGYEVWAELVLREPDQHHRKGWHPTGIFGAIGATAACARLAGLSSAQAATALAIAASHSSGLMANFGSMTKPLHAGRAAHTGVIASQLAEAGFTAASDALEHAQGLMRAVSPEGRADLASPIKAGKDWHILRNGINIKQYPTCFSTHRGLDGMRELMDAHRFAAGDVERLHISMSRRNALILRNHRPRTALEGKFSIEFALAAMLVAGKLTLSELDDAFVCSPEVQTLIEKVEIVHDDREDAVTGYAPYDELTVHMRDGSRLSTRVSDTGGSSAKPLSSDELFSKFSACLDAGGFTQDASAFFGALSVIDQDTGFHAMFERWLES